MAAKYELYQDKKGEYRWRLRHQNGNIIADSAEGYSSKAGALNGIESVKKNVGEAEIKDLSVPPAPEAAPPPAAKAKYELYQDKKGEYRWRLLHQNGNIIADSAEGYSSKAGALNGIDSVRKNVGEAEIKDLSAPPAPEPAPPPPPPPPAAKAKYELYQDKKGEYRWRLRHLNGNIIADSAEGYSSKAGALNGIESVRKNVGDAEIKEIAAAPQATPAVAVVTPPPPPPPLAQPVVKQTPPTPQPVVKPAPPPKAPEPIPMPPPAQPVVKQELEPVKPEPKPEPPPKAPEPIPMPPPQPAAKKEPEPVKPEPKPEPPPQPAAKQEPPKEKPRTFRPGTRGDSGGGDNNNMVAIAGIILAIGFFICMAAVLLATAV